MAKKPAPFIGQDYTKAQLIVLVKKLQASERKLLNQVAKLEEHKTIITRELHREVTLEEALDKAAEPSALPGIGPCKPTPGALGLGDEHLNPMNKPAFPWEPK